MKIESKTLEELEQIHEYGPVEGVFKVNDDDYHAFKAGVNSTSIKAAAISLAHYNAVAHPDESMPLTWRPDYFAFGSAFHAYMLDKDEFNKSFIAKPKLDLRTKEGRAWKLENKDKHILDELDMYKIEQMAKNIYESDYWQDYTAGEHYTEVAMFWVCPTSNMQCKSKVDLLSLEHGILDLKTTAKPITSKDIFYGYKNFRYDLQEAHYVAGVRACVPYMSEAFALGWCEKSPPFTTRLTVLDESTRRNTEAEYKALMLAIDYANRNNQYPGLGNDGILEVRL